MFFKYTGESMGLDLPPRAVYARIDQVEIDNNGELVEVLLDCVNAEWIDEVVVGGGFRSKNDGELRGLDAPDYNVSIISIMDRSIFKNLAELEPSGDSPWFFMEFDGSKGVEVFQYLNLFQAPVPRQMSKLEAVDGGKAAGLDKKLGWDDIKASTLQELTSVLKRQQPGLFDAIGVYDVGQGAASALLHEGAPLLYYDFGGGVAQHTYTYPQDLHQFCFTYSPPIILSHWDWDHWSSASRDTNALFMDWIVPIQKRAGPLGAVHTAFVEKIKEAGDSIYWWPEGYGEISFQEGECVFSRKATRSKKRNETGISMFVDCDDMRVLVCGDASYNNIHNCPSEVDHLVVSHHGGRVNMGKAPKPRCKHCGTLIYSYGENNRYKHALPNIKKNLKKKGWRNEKKTEDRGGRGLGHVGIDLSSGRRHSCVAPCRNAFCDLSIRRWI